MKRCSGVLMPIFSLPSEYGSGDFGKAAYKFIDLLSKTGVKVWQILPLVQTGYGNSPYSSVSSESFNPFFISPDVLIKKKLLKKEEADFSRQNGKYIDYGSLYSTRYPLLEKAFERFDKTDKRFKAFVKRGEYLDYALFMTLKYASGQKHFYEWSDEYKYRDHAALKKFASEYKDKILFWQFVQYEAKEQWLSLKKYANANGVRIMGDLPLYVALDSVDVWKEPSLFKIDNDFTPKKVAGVPPDYFCKDGQLWGNPVYDYDYMKKDGFKWWTERLYKMLKIYDYLRIDHFRGLDRYYEVNYGAMNARDGNWVKVPSDELFAAINSKINADKIVAEDLGIIDDGVRDLLKKTGYPGMKILSFAFNGDKGNLYLPENIGENCVCYTGTHDNDTLKGFLENASQWDYDNFYNGVKESLVKLGVKADISTVEGLVKAVIELGAASNANLFILPVQDLLGYSSDYRINVPGIVREQNWAVKFGRQDLTAASFKPLKKLIIKYNR